MNAKEAPAGDAGWSTLDRNWYRSGKPYRMFDHLAQLTDPNFHSWLSHPAYDGYWQKMLPAGPQFAKINIPVLTVIDDVVGDDVNQSAGALHYFTQHYGNLPDARHTLLLASQGSYGSGADVDLREMRLQWFDSVLKNVPAPALLIDRVNYRIGGSGDWRHAASISAMANGAMKLYLDPAASAGRHHLAESQPTSKSSVSLAVDFRDRRDSASVAGARDVLPANSVIYLGDPLPQAIEVGGVLSGELDFGINKLDMDLNITLRELTSAGESLAVFDPCELRASYAQNRSERQLLKPRERQQLAFRCEQVVSRRVQAGSRLQLVLGINKRADREINYGTGNDVQDESVADARIPLQVLWHDSSFISIPVWKR
jgi:predicted acyl esterase